MNEINFEIKDVEKIDLSMDVGIKEIYPPIENLNVVPNKEQQLFTHENSYGYDKVTVEPIPDEYIIPEGTLPITENITYDVRNYAKVTARVYPAPNLQDKELTIDENGTYIITADEEYDGLDQVSVTVDAIEDLEDELSIYNEELTEQETTIETLIQALKNKGIGEVPKYAPKYISFRSYTYDNLDYEVANLDTSNMTSFDYLFYGCVQLTELNLEHFNTSNVESMNYLFQGDKRLKTIKLSNWDTSKVKNFNSTFSNCEQLINLDVSNFITTSATTFANMFSTCAKITELDLSKWDTSNVQYTNYMFQACYVLANLNLDNWNMSKVTNISYMFKNCFALKTLNIKDWDLTSVKGNSNSYYVFQGCNGLETIDLSGWDTSNFTNIVYFFDGCNSLKDVNVSNWNVGKVTAINYMFQNCSALETLDLSGWILNTTAKVAMLGVFNGCTSLKHLDIRQWDFSRVSSYTSIFTGVPVDCEIIVKDDTAKQWILTQRSDFTNIKTVAELDGGN